MLRRACLLGRATRANVTRAFGVSEPTATKDLRHAANRWPGYLEYAPSRGVFVKTFAPAPFEASNTTFLQLLENAAPPHALGLTEAESIGAISASRFVYRGSAERKVVLILLKACLARVPMDIEHVGMRLGEMRKVRTVLPLGLELLGHQWRMIALDVEVRTRRVSADQKIFVLARILNAQSSLLLHRKRLKAPNGEPLEVRRLHIESIDRDYQVTLNRRLTGDQVEAVVREFSLSKRGDAYVIRMPERSLVEFKRDHCSKLAAPDDENELKDFALPLFESIRPYAAR